MQNTPYFIANLVDSLGEAIHRGVVMTFVLFILRLLLRNDWVAGVLAVVLFTAMLSAQTTLVHPGVIFIFAFIGAVQVALTMRFGFLAKVASEIPVAAAALVRTLDSSNWYATYSYVAIAWVALLALIAFRIATAGQRLLNDDDA